jgi:carbon-monoxide dehydrogenase medium subunit
MHELQRGGPALRLHETPAHIEDALELLERHGERARLVAGGTDLLLELERRQRPGVDVLVDVSQIAGLGEVSESPDGSIHLGPLVTHADVVRSELLVAHALPLAQACLEVGSPEVRSVGTVAGSLVTGAATSDATTALVALDARVLLRSTRGERRCRVGEVARIRADELLVDIIVPKPAPGRRGIFVKLRARRGQSAALANLAIVLVQAKGGEVTSARIALGGLAPATLLADAGLIGSHLGEDAIARAAAVARAAAAGSSEHLQALVEVMARRALRTLRDGSERSSWPEPPVTLGTPSRPASEARRHEADAPIEATVNGRTVRAPRGEARTLLVWLREALGLTGAKSGCAEGVCGSCTVQLDGAAVLACLVPAARAHGATIVTIEGLDANAHPLQSAFVACGAVQCGFCTPGFVMAGASLLAERPHPTRAEIDAAYAGHLCRCTGYQAIVRAVQRAAGEPGDGDRDE